MFGGIVIESIIRAVDVVAVDVAGETPNAMQVAARAGEPTGDRSAGSSEVSLGIEETANEGESSLSPSSDRGTASSLWSRIRPRIEVFSTVAAGSAVFAAMPDEWAPIIAVAFGIRGSGMVLKSLFPEQLTPDKRAGRVVRWIDFFTFLPHIAHGTVHLAQAPVTNGTFQVANGLYASQFFQEARTSQFAFPSTDQWALPLYVGGSAYYIVESVRSGGSELSHIVPGVLQGVADALLAVPGGADTVAGSLFLISSTYFWRKASGPKGNNDGGYEVIRSTIWEGRPSIGERIALGVGFGGGLLLTAGIALDALSEDEERRSGDNTTPTLADAPPPDDPGEAPVGPEEPEDPKPQLVVNVEDGLNLREEPTAFSDPFAGLRPVSLGQETGDRKIDEAGNQWISVQEFGWNAEENEGWVMASLVPPHADGAQNEQGRINPELQNQGYHWVEVQPGQTIGDIAREHSIDVAETVMLNMDHIVNPNLIFAGDRIYLPAAT
jgi:hypothetical protein